MVGLIPAYVCGCFFFFLVILSCFIFNCCD